MHPHVQTWGSILRLYGSRVAESYLKNENEKTEENSGDESAKEKLVPQQQKAKPNKELLEKLKEEMRKIKKVCFSHLN